MHANAIYPQPQARTSRVEVFLTYDCYRDRRLSERSYWDFRGCKSEKMLLKAEWKGRYAESVPPPISVSDVDGA